MPSRYAPWPAIRLAAPEAGEDPAGGGAPKSEELGFPDATPLTEMTAEQQTAYWKHKARKHEDLNKQRADYDDLKARAKRADELEQASQTEQEKALQQAREEARREGENLGASRYLADAIRADLRASTGKSNEDLAPVMGVIDTSKFVKDDGDIDSEKLAEFAATFGISTPQQSTDPARAALARNRTTSTQKNVGSVNERRRQRAEELTKH
jgi:hypothetical protein